MITNLLLTALVSVQPVALAAPVTPGAVAPAATATAAAPQPARTVEPRYCIVDTPPNSRIARKYCNSRADWAHKGVDIP